MEKRTDWQERAAKLFCICVYVVGIYFTFRYLLGVFLPFIIALVFGTTVSKISQKAAKASRLPYGLCAAVITTVIFVFFSMTIIYCCRRLLSEVSRVLSELSSFSAEMSAFWELLNDVPLLSYLKSAVEIFSSDGLQTAVSGLLSLLGSGVGKILSATPAFFVGAVVTITSCFYVSIDHHRIFAFFGKILPNDAKKRIMSIRSSFAGVMWKYLGAYAKLFLITFFEVLVGFFILTPSYAVIGALAVACIDILPIFGAGIVLVPMSILSFVKGQILNGIGYIILYMVVTLVRQIAEPRFIGQSAGSHPLAAIAAMYCGYKFFGGVGTLLCPLLLSVAVDYQKKKKGE